MGPSVGEDEVLHTPNAPLSPNPYVLTAPEAPEPCPVGVLWRLHV